MSAVNMGLWCTWNLGQCLFSLLLPAHSCQQSRTCAWTNVVHLLQVMLLFLTLSTTAWFLTCTNLATPLLKTSATWKIQKEFHWLLRLLLYLLYLSFPMCKHWHSVYRFHGLDMTLYNVWHFSFEMDTEILHPRSFKVGMCSAMCLAFFMNLRTLMSVVAYFPYCNTVSM